MTSQPSAQPSDIDQRCHIPNPFKRKAIQNAEQQLDELPIFETVEENGTIDASICHELNNIEKYFRKGKKEKVDEFMRLVRIRNTAFPNVLRGIIQSAQTEPGPTAAKKGRSNEFDGTKIQSEVKVCFNALKPCLKAIQSMGESEGKTHFLNIVFLTQIAAKMATSVYFGVVGGLLKDSKFGEEDQTFSEVKETIINLVKKIRKTLKLPLKNAQLPVGALNFSLSRLEIGIKAAPNPSEKREALKSGIKLLVGAAQAATSWKLNSALKEGVVGLAKLGMDKVIQNQADHVFKKVARNDYFAVYMQQTVFGQPAPSTKTITELKATLLQLQNDALAESRWEIIASFVDVLAATVLGDGTGVAGKTIHQVDFDLLVYVVKGDSDPSEESIAQQGKVCEKFLGLAGLASFGEDLPVKDRLNSGCDVPFFALDRWASNVFDLVNKMRLDGKSIRDGVEIAQAQAEMGLQDLQDKLIDCLQNVSVLIENEISNLVQFPFRLAMGQLVELLGDKENAPKKPGDNENAPKKPGDKDNTPKKPGDKDKTPKKPGDKDNAPKKPGDTDNTAQTQEGKDNAPKQEEVLAEGARKRLTMVQSGLKKTNQALMNIKKTVDQFLDILTKTRQVVEQATTFLSRLNTFFGADEDFFEMELKSVFFELCKSCKEELAKLKECDNTGTEPSNPTPTTTTNPSPAAPSPTPHPGNGANLEDVFFDERSKKLEVAARVISALCAAHSVMTIYVDERETERERKQEQEKYKRKEGEGESSTERRKRESEREEAREKRREREKEREKARQEKLAHQEKALDNLLDTCSKFRMLAGSHQGLLAKSKDSSSAGPLAKSKDPSSEKNVRDEIHKSVKENCKTGQRFFSESQVAINALFEFVLNNNPDWEKQGQGGEAGDGDPGGETLNESQSLGLVTARLKSVTASLKEVENRASKLQQVLGPTRSQVVEEAVGLVESCKTQLLEYYQNEAGSDARSDARKKLEEAFYSLEFCLFGFKNAPTGEPAAGGTDAHTKKNSVVAMLGELGTRGVVLMSDCTGVLQRVCDLTTKHANADGKPKRVSFDKKLGLRSNLDEELKDTMKDILQHAKEEMAGKACEVVGEAWKEVNSKVEETLDEYEGELEALSGVLRGAFDVGQGLWEMVRGNVASRSRKELWRVRDRAVFQMMAIRCALKSKPRKSKVVGTGDDDNENAEHHSRYAQLQKDVDMTIVRRRALEQQPGIKKTLNSDMFEKLMTNVVEEGLQGGEGGEDKLKDEIEDRMQTVIQLEDQMMTETDAVRKQAGLITLHREKTALNKVLTNVKDINHKFHVMKSTMDQMSKQLEVINAKLDALTGIVQEIQQDIRRLVGLAPLIVLEQYRLEQLSKGGKMMRDEVYIELQPNAKKHPRHQGKTLMSVATDFLKSKDKGSLLVSGRAGSGKSVFATKLEQYILDAYWNYRSKEQGTKKVILIWANLPALKNPLTGLFEEALQKYHFLPDQVRRLREEIQKEDSEVEAVFVLDGYDELRPEFQFRNLYKTNNLESYRPRRDPNTPEGKALFAFPKVITLCREELLSSNIDGYEAAFLPIEPFNVHKDEPQAYFDEVEIAELESDKFEEYAREYVALQVRSAFFELFPSYKIEAQAKDWQDDTVLRFLVENVKEDPPAADGTQASAQENVQDVSPAADGTQATTPAGNQITTLAQESISAAPVPAAADVPRVAEETVDVPNELYCVHTGEKQTVESLRPRTLERIRSIERSRASGDILSDDTLDISDERDEQADQKARELIKKVRAHDHSHNGQIVVWPIHELGEIKKLFHSKEHATGTLNSRDKSVKKQLQSLAKSLAAPLKAATGKESTVMMKNLRTHLQEVSEELPGPTDASGVDLPGTLNAVQPRDPNGNAAGVGGDASGAGVSADDTAGARGESVVSAEQQGDGDSDDIWLSHHPDAAEDFRLMFHFLFKVAQAAPSKSREDQNNFLKELSRRKLWSAGKIVEEYKELPELEKLTKTPFMIKIVVKILPFLKELSATLSSVKQELILRLNDESMADIAWARLQHKKITHNDEAIGVVQALWGLVDDDRTETDADCIGTPLKHEERKMFRKFIQNQLKLTLKEVAAEIAEQKQLLDQESVDEESVLKELMLSLKRKPVRRFLIYSEFMKNYSEQEQVKLASRASSVKPEQIVHEFWQYSQRLAVKMTGDVLTKVTYHPGSLIFSDTASDEWHPFFGSGDKTDEHREVVRRVAPLKSQNNTHSFIHKSVQEFFVAMAICDSILLLVKQTLIPESQLRKWFNQIRSLSTSDTQHAVLSSPKKSPMTRMNSSLISERGKNEDWDVPEEDLGLRDLQDALKQIKSDENPAKRKRHAKAINKLVQGLCEGPLNTIDLSGEEAVRDFLLDTLLDDIQVASTFRAITALCLTERIHKGKLQFLAENLYLLFTAPLPKRHNNTLLHIACHPDETNVILVKMVLEFCLDKDYRPRDWAQVLVPKNKEGHTPLMVCLRSKNAEMASMLLESCFSESMKEEVISNCETRKSEMTSLSQGPDTESVEPLSFSSGEKIFVSSGKAYFEVAVDLGELKILSIDNDETNPTMFGFGGSLCVGFAAGAPPTPEKLYGMFEQTYKNVRAQESSDQAARKEKKEKKRAGKEDVHTKDKTLANQLVKGKQAVQKVKPAGSFVGARPTDNQDAKEKSIATGNFGGARQTEMQHHAQEKALELKMRKEWIHATNRRLRTCPLGGDITPGFHSVAGVAIHVVEPFKNVVAGSKRQAKLEMLCERLVVPVPHESVVDVAGTINDEGAQEGQIGTSHKPLLLFPQRAGGSVQAGGRQGGALEQTKKMEGSYLHEFDVTKLRNSKRDRFGYLGVAIDFQDEGDPDAIVMCCWATKSTSGQWHEVARVPKDEGPFFPVVCSWGLQCRPVIDLGGGSEQFRVKAPGDGVGFQHYKNSVLGIPGHYKMAKEGEWDMFFKLVEEVELKQRFGLLTYLDPDNGNTLLHSFVEESNQSTEGKVKTLLDAAKTLLQGPNSGGSDDVQGKEHSLENMVLAKDASGYSAFSTVTDRKVARCIMQCVDDVSARGKMMNDLVDRLFKETSDLDLEDDNVDLDEEYLERKYVDRIRVLDCELKLFTSERNDLEDGESQEEIAMVVTSNFLRKFRKMRENQVFFTIVLKGILDGSKESQFEEGGSEAASSIQHDETGAPLYTNVPRCGGGEEDGSEVSEGADQPKLAELMAYFILPQLGSAGMKHLSKSMKDDDDIIELAVMLDSRSLEHAGAKFIMGAEFATCLEKAVQYDGLALRAATNALKSLKRKKGPSDSRERLDSDWSDRLEHLLKEETIVEKAVCRTGRALRDAALLHRRNKDIVLKAVENDGMALKYASEELRSNKEVVKAAVKQNCMSLRWADMETLRRNDADAAKEIVKKAAEKHGMVLALVPESMRKDPDLVLAAVRTTGRAIKYAPDEFKNNDDVVREVVKSDPLALRFVGERYKTDSAFILDLLDQSPQVLRLMDESLLENEEVQTRALMRHPQAVFEMIEVFDLEDDVEHWTSMLEVQSETATWSCIVFLLLVHKAIGQLENRDSDEDGSDNENGKHSGSEDENDKKSDEDGSYNDNGKTSDSEDKDDMVDEDDEGIHMRDAVNSDSTEDDEDAEDGEVEVFVTLCHWLLEGLSCKTVEPEPARARKSCKPGPRAGLIKAAAEWLDGTENNTAMAGALDLSECWGYLVRLLTRIVENMEKDLQEEREEREEREGAGGAGEAGEEEREMKESESVEWGMEERKASEKIANDEREELERTEKEQMKKEKMLGRMKKAVHDVVKASIQSNGMLGELLQFASDADQKDKQLVLRAIEKSSGAAFEFATELHGDFEVAKQAVQLDPMALRHVNAEKLGTHPAKGSTQESTELEVDYREMYKSLCHMAMKKDGMALQHVKKEHLPKDSMGAIAAEAVQQNGMALQFDMRKPVALCALAVAQNLMAIEHVPPQHVKRKKDAETDSDKKIKDFVMLAVRRDAGVLRYLPEWAKEKDVAKLAVEVDGTSLKYVKGQAREDPEVCRIAVQQNGTALQFVESEDFINHPSNLTVITRAVEQHGSMLEYAPHNLCHDRDAVEAAIESDILALQFSYLAFEPSKLDALLKTSVGNQKNYPFELPKRVSQFSDAVTINHDTKIIEFKDYATVFCPRMVALRGCKMYYEVEIVEVYEDDMDDLWMQFGFADQTFNPGPDEGVGDVVGSAGVDMFRRVLWANGRVKKWDEQYASLDSKEQKGQEGAGDLEEGAVGGEEREHSPEDSSKADSLEEDSSEEDLSEEDSSEEDMSEEDWSGDGGDSENGGRSPSLFVGTVLGLLCDPMRGTISFWANGSFISQLKSNDYRNAFEDCEFTGPGLFPALSGRGFKIRYNLGEPDKNGKNKFNFSSNPLRRTHNMEEWFFQAPEGAPVNSAIHAGDDVMKKLAEQAKHGYVDEDPDKQDSPTGEDSTFQTLELDTLDLTIPMNVISAAVELPYGAGEFSSKEEEFRWGVADVSGFDVSKVTVRSVEPRGNDGVVVGFSVEVPSNQADSVAAGLTLKQLNRKLEARGIQEITAVTDAARVEDSKLPPTVTATKSMRSSFAEVADSFPDIDDTCPATKEATRLSRFRFQQEPAEEPVVVRLNEPFSGLKYIPYEGDRASNHVGVNFDRLQVGEVEKLLRGEGPLTGPLTQAQLRALDSHASRQSPGANPSASPGAPQHQLPTHATPAPSSPAKTPGPASLGQPPSTPASVSALLQHVSAETGASEELMYHLSGLLQHLSPGAAPASTPAPLSSPSALRSPPPAPSHALRSSPPPPPPPPPEAALEAVCDVDEEAWKRYSSASASSAHAPPPSPIASALPPTVLAASPPASLLMPTAEALASLTPPRSAAVGQRLPLSEASMLVPLARQSAASSRASSVASTPRLQPAAAPGSAAELVPLVRRPLPLEALRASPGALAVSPKQPVPTTAQHNTPLRAAPPPPPAADDMARLQREVASLRQENEALRGVRSPTVVLASPSSLGAAWHPPPRPVHVASVKLDASLDAPRSFNPPSLADTRSPTLADTRSPSLADTRLPLRSAAPPQQSASRAAAPLSPPPPGGGSGGNGGAGGPLRVAPPPPDGDKLSRAGVPPRVAPQALSPAADSRGDDGGALAWFSPAPSPAASARGSPRASPLPSSAVPGLDRGSSVVYSVSAAPPPSAGTPARAPGVVTSPSRSGSTPRAPQSSGSVTRSVV